MDGGEAELGEKVIGEAFVPRLGFEEKLPFFLHFRGVGGRGAALREVVAPFVLAFRGGRGVILPAVRVRLIGVGVLQDGVGLDLLLDEGFEFEDGRLQEMQGLAHLGR